MEYRVGLDMGTSSIGWCCLLIEDGSVTGILDIGVRIFSDGRNDQSKEPLCAERRDYRSSRRRLERYKLRRASLIKDLVSAGLLPADKTEFKKLEKLNPYKLRYEAVHRMLTLNELGRVFFHIDQRRGFQSNRKEEKKDKAESSAMLKAINELDKRIADSGCVTLGEYMYKESAYRYKGSADAKGNQIIGSTYPSRQMYKDEFDKIWEFQKKYYGNLLTDDLRTQIRDRDIFYQRPLKKQEAGFCSLEPEERRGLAAYPVSQNFRIISEVANLKITWPVERFLTQNERNILYSALIRPAKDLYNENFEISFANIIKLTGLSEDTIFNLMKNNRYGIKCNVTNIVMSDECAFGLRWFDYTSQQQQKIIDILSDYTLTDEDLTDSLSEEIPDLSEERLRFISEQSLLLPDGYVKLSVKAMSKLSEDMQACGTTYADSVANVYHKNVNELQSFSPRQELPRYQELFADECAGGNRTFARNLDYDGYMGRITNVSVHIALNQLRMLVNELIKKYGKPSGITIELARELTKGKKALANIEKRQKINKKITDEACHLMRKAGIPITPFNIEKYKVWYNLNPKKPHERRDLYTGKVIEITDLFSSDYEIEHILPYSWTYDDSYNNKVITKAVINRCKSNRLPYDFFSDESQLAGMSVSRDEAEHINLKEITERAKDIDKARNNSKRTFNFNAISWRFSKNARDIFNRNNKNASRDLSDTQYMSSLARKYLTCICDNSNIVSASGQITDIMKKTWDISDVLPEDYRLWKVQKWQRDALLEKEKRKLSEGHPDFSDEQIEELAKQKTGEMSAAEIQDLTSVKKDRSVHYHHALDAFILANITPSIVQNLSGTGLADRTEDYLKGKKAEGKEVTLQEARLSLLKQSGRFYGKPYTNFDKKELADRLAGLVVSYRKTADSIKSAMHKAKMTGRNLSEFSIAPVCEATAFGFVNIDSISGDEININFSVRKKGEKAVEKHALSSMVPVFRTKANKKIFMDMYIKWKKACVRRKAKLLSEQEYKKIETDFILSFTKDKAFKWYASAGNYGAQIYKINKNDKITPNKKEKFSLEIITNYYAFERRGKFFWKDVYPTAKLITTLSINDVVEAAFNLNENLDKGFKYTSNWIKEQFSRNPGKNEINLLFRVKKLTGGSIYMRPMHIAQEDGDTKTWKCSISSFQNHKCRKVYVTPAGSVLRGK